MRAGIAKSRCDHSAREVLLRNHHNNKAFSHHGRAVTIKERDLVREIREKEGERRAFESGSLVLASVIDGPFCHFKNSELEPQFQKYKDRVVLRGDIVKDASGLCAVFTEQGSSALQLTAAKVMDIISWIPGCSRQEPDAVSAYTRSKWQMHRHYCKFRSQNVQMFGYVYRSTNGQNNGPVWKIQSFFSKGICTVILWQDYCGKGN